MHVVIFFSITIANKMYYGGLTIPTDIKCKFVFVTQALISTTTTDQWFLESDERQLKCIWSLYSDWLRRARASKKLHANQYTVIKYISIVVHHIPKTIDQ